MLRGGAFKPRTPPYSFQGMGTPGLDLLVEARTQTGLPIVSEIMDPRMAELFEREVDLVQVGRSEHAELRAAEGGGQDEQAHPPQARPFQHL